MKEKLAAYAYLYLQRIKLADDNEKYLFLISFIASTYAISMQLFLLFFHLIIGDTILFFIYLCGFLIDLSLFWLVCKRRYPLFGILLSFVVIVETLLSSVCIGTDNFIIVYLFVALLMQIIIPYASIRIRALVVAALWGSMMALVYISNYMVPIKDIGEANTILAFFNIHLAFFGTVIQLTIGNAIWDMIMKFNLEKLEESESEANTDPLTGLLNRRYADTFFNKLRTGQLEQIWCVAMVDIDDFKRLNDTYGHRVGDGVLQFISDFFMSNLRSSDLVFRWGGEEFLILLKDASVALAFRVLDKLRGKLESEMIQTHDRTITVTVTIGVCPLDIQNVDKSIESSDRLMYEGKGLGKNMVVM
ncbi:MAG: GGDEF domain-containing protein [Bacillota bacterium]|nr:GGDEF domain-containing protein [Bacillota bacterium]